MLPTLYTTAAGQSIGTGGHFGRYILVNILNKSGDKITVAITLKAIWAVTICCKI